ncbi:MAG: ferrous iron transport protein B [Ruminococcaceae bacterium]|nr:ferrous iron transport protein B [Oscillospiraceae bacterium]
MSLTIALVGNPNCGKTTVFNALTGSKEYVGNRAGVTVEEKKGRLKGNSDITVVDLPGIYSLSPYTSEEIITEKYIAEKAPDVILNVADASGIERSLYLTTQLTEKGIPVVLMLNMWDYAEKKGIIADAEKLSRLLGIKVLKTSASKGEGLSEAVRAAVEAAKEPYLPNLGFYGRQTENALRQISTLIKGKISEKQTRSAAVKLLERGSGGLKLDLKEQEKINEIRSGLSRSMAADCEEIIISKRYDFIEKTVKECVVKTKTETTATERIDRILTGKYTAIPCFLAIMALVYFLSAGPIGSFLSAWLTDFITNDLGEALEAFLVSVNTADWTVSLIRNGIIGGVGSVLGFLPQLALLFLMLSLLEDLGYMARAAFIMDRFFRFFGLSGKSFIPMLIATGCGVPAVMSSRTIDNPAHRRMTIITSTFMPCGAKLPVISMVSVLFFEGKWWVAPICYLIGISAVLLSGLILKNTFIFKDTNAPFIIELPEYRMPTAKNTLKTVYERTSSFVKRAGSVILLASAAIWFLSGFKITSFGIAPAENSLNSILGSAGEKIAPIFTPLGFGDWRAAVASLMGLLAKEELVGVFGVVGTAESVFNGGLEAFSFLIFNLLCSPCIAAVTAIGKEMNSFKWTLFALLYQTMLAYTVSLIVYQLGLLISGGVHTQFTFAAFAAAAAVLILFFRAVEKKKIKVKSR